MNLLKMKLKYCLTFILRSTYFAINVLNVINCLDRSKAVLDIDEKYNKIKNISKYAFHKNKIEHERIFKILEKIFSEIFVTDIFKDKVEQAGLTGFRFADLGLGERILAYSRS